MAYYDREINIVNDLCECDNSEIFIFNDNDEEILQCVRKVEEWQCSSSKSDPPPDFYSNKYKLMMEVMRVDDHAYINAKGKVINPHIKKENETYKEIQKFVKDNNISFSGNIFVNTVTDLSTQEDHSYDKYLSNFKRVIDNHNSSYDLYKNNHHNRITPGQQNKDNNLADRIKRLRELSASTQVPIWKKKVLMLMMH